MRAHRLQRQAISTDPGFSSLAPARNRSSLLTGEIATGKRQSTAGAHGWDRPVPASVHAVVDASGEALEPALRSEFESGFGHDFSGVRVHHDGPAAESANAVDALAYTMGRDIVFARDQFRPGHSEGRTLLAHELAHVASHDAGSTSCPLQRQPRPRPAAVDADAQAIIDIAANSSTAIAERAVQVVRAIIARYFPGDADKVSDVRYNAGLSGLEVEYHGTGAATTGAIGVGDSFVNQTTQAGFARRVLQVRHEIEHIEQVRSGMAGGDYSDEREFIAFYHEALATELPGTGRMQHATRVGLIDAALGYYHCLEQQQQRDHASKRDELKTRRAEKARLSGRTDLGNAPTSCRRGPGDTGPRRRRAGLSGGAIAGIVIGSILGAGAIGLGVAALAGAFS